MDDAPDGNAPWRLGTSHDAKVGDMTNDELRKRVSELENELRMAKDHVIMLEARIVCEADNPYPYPARPVPIPVYVRTDQGWIRY